MIKQIRSDIFLVMFYLRLPRHKGRGCCSDVHGRRSCVAQLELEAASAPLELEAGSKLLTLAPVALYIRVRSVVPL